MQPDAVIFVYNANAGKLAGLLDTVHKTLSPSTYDCQLCAVTFGAFAMRPEWRDWLKAQPWSAEFFHRPDFRAAWPAHAQTPLPAIFRRDGDTLCPLIGAEAFKRLDSVNALAGAIEAALA
ncbi:MAG: hypothetical protein ABL882_04505 [Sphingopyxis sp.]